MVIDFENYDGFFGKTENKRKFEWVTFPYLPFLPFLPFPFLSFPTTIPPLTSLQRVSMDLSVALLEVARCFRPLWQ